MPNRATGEVLPGLGVVADIGHLRDVISRFTSMEEAKAAVGRCREVLPDASVSQLDRMPLKDATEMERFRDSLRKAGLPE